MPGLFCFYYQGNIIENLQVHLQKIFLFTPLSCELCYLSSFYMREMLCSGELHQVTEKMATELRHRLSPMASSF